MKKKKEEESRRNNMIVVQQAFDCSIFSTIFFLAALLVNAND